MIASTKYLAREDLSDNHQIKPSTSSLILKILKILIQKPCDSIHLQMTLMLKPKTSSVILEILKILIQNQVADKYNFEPINVSKLLGSPKEY